MQHRTWIPSAILAIFIVLNFSTALAQDWVQTNGPSNGAINCVRTDSHGGIYVSAGLLMYTPDEGASWRRLGFNDGMEAGELEINSNDEILNSTTGGVWYANGANSSWKLIFPRAVYNDAVMWDSSGTIFIFAASGGQGYCYSSTNRGSTWDSIAVGIQGAASGMYKVGNDGSGNLFIDAGPGLYRSSDRGMSWDMIVNGNAGGLLPIVIDRSGTWYAVGGGHVAYQSSDKGRSWKLSTPSLFFGSVGLYSVDFLCVNSGGYLLNELLVRSPDGKFFFATEPNIGSQPDTAAIAKVAKKRTGTQLPYSYLNPQITTAAPLGATGFVVGIQNQVFVIDFGIDSLWHELCVPTAAVYRMLFSRKDILIASTSTPSQLGSQPYAGLPTTYQDFGRRSTDLGGTWGGLTGQVYGWQGQGFVTLVLDSSGYLLGTPRNSGSILRSSDEGLTWTGQPQYLGSQINSLAVRSAGEIFAGTSYGVFRSTDNGDSWDEFTLGMAQKNIFSVGIHDNGDVFAGGSDTMYRSTDDGMTWTQLPFAFGRSSMIISIISTNQGNLIAAALPGADSGSGGVVISTDNGDSWKPLGSGLGSAVPHDLLSTPSGTCFLATDRGVYTLPLGDSEWIPLMGGLTELNALSLARNSDGEVFVGTYGAGIFKSSHFYGKNQKQTVATMIGSSLSISSYPNPFHGASTISYSTPRSGYVELSLCDALGRPISAIVSGEVAAGVHSQRFDASHLARGSYFIRLVADGAVLMRAITVLE